MRVARVVRFARAAQVAHRIAESLRTCEYVRAPVIRRSLTRPIVVACILLLVAACSDSSKPSSSASSSAPPPPAEAAKAYEDPGSFPVGVTTLTLPAGNKVEVWYPAVAGTTGTVSYDVRDFTPEGIKALLTANIPATFSYPGARDAQVADGSFPLVFYSHGFSSFRVGSSHLTSHLASWGMVVAAPDHPSRDLTARARPSRPEGRRTRSTTSVRR